MAFLLYLICCIIELCSKKGCVNLLVDSIDVRPEQEKIYMPKMIYPGNISYTLKPSSLHAKVTDEIIPYLSFDPQKDFNEQQTAVRERLLSLLKMPEKKTAPVPLIEWEDDHAVDFHEIRFHFESEPDFYVPAHLVLPKKRSGKLPVVICLQGHSKGMHVSMARADIGSKEVVKPAGDRDFARQAVARGYAAVIMEQRGFGEQISDVAPQQGCRMPAMQALALGRTLLGERVFDVSRLIDSLAHFEMLDMTRLGLMGNSAGGTTSYYTAAVDERVKVVMPSCAVGEFAYSFLKYNHCVCGFVPDFYTWFDMPDLALAIAPRPLVIVGGEHDEICEAESVWRAWENKIKPIYQAANSPQNCRLVMGAEGHRFYADLSWPVFDEYI